MSPSSGAHEAACAESGGSPEVNVYEMYAVNAAAMDAVVNKHVCCEATITAVERKVLPPFQPRALGRAV